ncbi:N-lysine methyltransferase SMYD2 [Podospora aff. communis PSN243]|uniref:N-lysine methyltransferase SMYD2 n=1 Tax=Podospora aff. communis PSN243 TaxID=3040156 RepID=A0AAV9GRJ9_9PEZI|nr:N-lysine methyltransferase SMYD2 [Podospora aff. communis PSN243]
MLLTLIALLFLTIPIHAQIYGINPTSPNNPPGPLSPLPHHTTCAPLLDDTDPPLFSPREPWSFPPHCTPPGSQNRPKLCTYTVTSLRGDGGISLLTTPEVAAHLAHVLQDADIAWLEKQRGYPLSAAPDKPYTIKTALKENTDHESDGKKKTKGLGVFAKRLIKEGEILMAQPPILVRLTEQRYWKVRDIYQALAQASTRLPLKEKETLLGMSRSGKGYVVEDIMKTNVFHITVQGVDHTGLYPEIARINHECRPNAFVRYSPQTLVVEAVAYKDIQPGEEVTVSYLPLNLLTEQRTQLIQEWGFNCTCSLCSNPKRFKTSDKNRDRIQVILESLDHPGNRTQAKVRAAVEEVEDLVVKEGLAGQLGDFYAIIADIYLNMGDLRKTRKSGRNAVKLLQHYAGFDNMRTEKAEEFMRELDALER